MSRSEVPVSKLEDLAYAIPWYMRIFVLPVAVLVIAVLSFAAMNGLSGEAETAPPSETVLPVEVITVAHDAGPATIVATGTVTAAQQVVLTPEVGGKLREVSEKLVLGGRFNKGELLARIDSSNYVAGLRLAEQQLEQARLELALERGRGEVAAREWRMLGQAAKAGRDAQLALREPQLAVAQAAVATAEAQLEKARMDVGRTRLTAPFNAVVVAESVDVGQVVGAGTQVATLVGTDRARVTVSVPVDQLPVVEAPGVARADGSLPIRGSTATVTQTLTDGSRIVREGDVLGISGQLDPQTRTAQVTVDIPTTTDPSGISLLPGAFVSVAIHGSGWDRAFRLPRTALSNGDTVWVVDEESTLRRREVSVAWSLPDAVVLSDGLSAGEQVVVSAMSNPLVGQRVAAQTREDAG